MSTVIIDRKLERLPFETHWGADISGKPNPPAPTATGYNDLADGWREFYVGGPGDTNVLYAVHRPVQHKSGMVHLNMDVMTDHLSYNLLRCFEIDTIITVRDARSKAGGYKFNLSSQFNHNSGLFEIAGANGGWLSTGLKVGRFIPYVPYSLQFDYWYDAASLRFSFVGMTMSDSPTFFIPLPLQNLVAVESNWGEVISLQYQMDIEVGVGGRISTYARDMQYVWDMAI